MEGFSRARATVTGETTRIRWMKELSQQSDLLDSAVNGWI